MWILAWRHTDAPDAQNRTWSIFVPEAQIVAVEFFDRTTYSNGKEMYPARAVVHAGSTSWETQDPLSIERLRVWCKANNWLNPIAIEVQASK